MQYSISCYSHPSLKRFYARINSNQVRTMDAIARAQLVFRHQPALSNPAPYLELLFSIMFKANRLCINVYCANNFAQSGSPDHTTGGIFIPRVVYTTREQCGFHQKSKSNREQSQCKDVPKRFTREIIVGEYFNRTCDI